MNREATILPPGRMGLVCSGSRPTPPERRIDVYRSERVRPVMKRLLLAMLAVGGLMLAAQTSVLGPLLYTLF